MAADPEAAKIVFNAGVPITMVGLGATSQARLTREDVEVLKDAGTELATVAAAMGEAYIDNLENVFGLTSANLHDPLAVGIAIDRSFATNIWPMRVDVETKGGLTYGETVADRFLSRSIVRDVGDHGTIEGFERLEPNADVPTEIDGSRFSEFFLERIGAE